MVNGLIKNSNKPDLKEQDSQLVHDSSFRYLQSPTAANRFLSNHTTLPPQQTISISQLSKIIITKCTINNRITDKNTIFTKIHINLTTIHCYQTLISSIKTKITSFLPQLTVTTFKCFNSLTYTYTYI